MVQWCRAERASIATVWHWVSAPTGGNRQRVMLARLIDTEPRILLLNDFARGVDVKAKAAIHKLVCDVACEGIAVCLTASDLDELLEVADRLVCTRAGRVVAERPIEEFDRLRMISPITSGAVAGIGADSGDTHQPS